MNAKSLLVLIVLLVAGAGAYFFSSGSGSINSADSIGAPILSGLYDSLNDVSTIQLVSAGDKVQATLQKKQGQWVVAERDGFPADIGKIRSLVLALAEAKIQEEKTSNPSLYSKLGVESVENTEAAGVKVIFNYGQNSQALVIGKPGPQINRTRYVRKADEKTSWLIDRKIDVNYETAHWLQKDITSVNPEDIARINIRLQDGATLNIFSHKHGDEEVFGVANLTNPDSQIVPAEIHQVTNALFAFQLLDVESSNDFQGGEPTYTADFVLKSGVTIKVIAYEIEKDHFMALQPSTSSTKQEDKDFVDQLTKLTQNRVFKVPNVTYDSILKREADVLAITEDQLN